MKTKEFRLEGLVNWVAKKSGRMSILIGKNNGLIRYPFHIPLEKQFENIKYGDKLKIIIKHEIKR